ncbi:hypothetical protein ACVWXL_003186 [Bradyrhizobium sp. GM22.5]
MVTSGSPNSRPQHIGPDPDHLTPLEQRPARMDAQRHRSHNAEGQHRQKRLEAALADRAGNDETAIADESYAEQRNALSWIGQGREHRQVPEQDLE